MFMTKVKIATVFVMATGILAGSFLVGILAARPGTSPLTYPMQAADNRTLSVLIPGEGVKLVKFASKADNQTRVKETVKRFEGTWVTISAEVNGKRASKEELQVLKGMTMTCEDSKFALKTADSPRVIKGTFTIDSGKTPKEYDASAVLGGKDGSIIGIYEFDEDNLRICYTPSGGKRPREFSTKDGTDDQPVYLTVYQRQSEKEKEDAVKEELAKLQGSSTAWLPPEIRCAYCGDDKGPFQDEHVVPRCLWDSKR
jgi:uncharacterized protein (TIGR03067 family)